MLDLSPIKDLIEGNRAPASITLNLSGAKILLAHDASEIIMKSADSTAEMCMRRGDRLVMTPQEAVKFAAALLARAIHVAE